VTPLSLIAHVHKTPSHRSRNRTRRTAVTERPRDAQCRWISCCHSM